MLKKLVSRDMLYFRWGALTILFFRVAICLVLLLPCEAAGTEYGVQGRMPGINKLTYFQMFIRQLRFQVSQERGMDCKDCLPSYDLPTARPPKHPCQSMTYGLNHLRNVAAALNWSVSIIVEFADHKYVLENTYQLKLNRSERVGIVLTKAPKVKNRVSIIAGHRHASFVIGEKGNVEALNDDKKREIRFEHLRWTNFSADVAACIVAYNFRAVHIYNNVFESNNCSAVNTLDSECYLNHSVFRHNRASYKHVIETLSFPTTNYSTGGALGFVFSQAQRMNVTITECTFQHNSAVIKGHIHSPKYIYHNATLNEFGRIGGGIAVIFTNRSVGNTATISHCSFYYNRAFAGAGLTGLFQDQATANSVICTDSLFRRNSAKEAAGGALFAIWDRACASTVLVSDSNFTENIANLESGSGGGAAKFVLNTDLGKGHALKCFHQVKFIRTKFEKNCAKMAPAIHLEGMAHNFQLPVLVHFHSCTIWHHYNCAMYGKGQVPRSGTFATNRIDVLLSGHTRIENNTVGTALASSNAIIYMNDHISFDGNKAEFDGGALSLRDVSFLVLSPGLLLSFVNNAAKLRGGAIFASGLVSPYAVYPYNPSCFMQYSSGTTAPRNWEVTVEFKNNSAGIAGAAVFSNTLWACSWTDEPPFVNIASALRWHDNFKYEGNFLNLGCSKAIGPGNDINTDNAEIRLHGDTELTIAPGELKKFNLTGIDELNNTVYIVPAAIVNGSFWAHTAPLLLDQKYYAIAPTDQALPKISYHVLQHQYDLLPPKASPNIKQKIYFSDSSSDFDSKAVLTLYPVQCRPGMVFERENGTCVCNTSIKEIFRCTEEAVYMQSGFWANSTDDNRLLWYRCPEKYCICGRGRDEVSNGCPIYFDRPNRQCVEHREGTLCGQCSSGYGASLNSYECVRCDKSGSTIAYLVVIVLIMVAFAIVVLVLNPGFSTYLRGPVFFCQTLPFLFFPSDRIGSRIRTVSTYLDIGSPSGLPIHGCLMEGMSSLHVIALEYLFPLVICVVLSIVYLLHKLRRLNLRRGSPFQAFWVLLVVVYKLLVETSILLWFCVPIGEDRVFFYDGSIKCFEGEHVPWAILSAIIFLTMVIPPPVLVILICRGYIRATPHVSDTLSKGLRRPYSWWWAVDFLRRILFVSLYVSITDWEAKQLFLTVAALVTFTLHAQCKPYEKDDANLGETFLLFNLTLLSTLQLLKDEPIRLWMSAVLLIASHGYVIVISVYCAWRFFRKQALTRTYRDSFEPADSVQRVSAADVTHRCQRGVCDRLGPNSCA